MGTSECDAGDPSRSTVNLNRLFLHRGRLDLAGVGARHHRFWYGWKMWSFAFTATWHACPQSEGLGSAEKLSDAAS